MTRETRARALAATRLAEVRSRNLHGAAALDAALVELKWDEALWGGRTDDRAAQLLEERWRRVRR